MKISRFIVLLFVLFVSIPESKAANVVNGVLDLRNRDLQQVPLVEMDGEWCFYWGRFINPSEYVHHDISNDFDLIKVPSTWNNKNLEKQYPSYGIATYYVKILVDNPDLPLSIDFKPAGTSARLYVNGEFVGEQGKIGEQKQDETPSMKRSLVFFGDPIVENGVYTYHFVVHVSNFYHQSAGLWNRIFVGEQQQVVKHMNKHLFWGLLVTGIMLAIMLMHILLFVHHPKALHVSFVLLVLNGVILSLTNEGRLIYFAFPNLCYEFYINISYWSSYMLPASILFYLSRIYRKDSLRRVETYTFIVFGIVFLFIFFAPASVISKYVDVLILCVGVVVMYILFHVLGHALVRKRSFALLNVISFIVLIISSINDVFFALELVHSEYIMHYGLFAFVIVQEFCFIAIAMRERKNVHALSHQLSELNLDLEKKVEARTQELIEQNSQLIHHQNELNLANNNLKDLQEFQYRLTRMLVHDLKAPLGTVLHLLDNVTEPDETILRALKDSALRMQMLVLNMLDIHKLEKAQMEISAKRVGLLAVVNDSLHRFSFQMQQRNIRVVNTVEERSYACVDLQLLERVIDNVLQNALHYSPSGGTIYIWCSRLMLNYAPGIRITIKDNGTGISKEVQERIFSESNVFSNASVDFVSHGLGLSFCKLALEAMHGEISFTTEVGVGSEFYIDLPMTDLPSK